MNWNHTLMWDGFQQTNKQTNKLTNNWIETKNTSEQKNLATLAMKIEAPDLLPRIQVMETKRSKTIARLQLLTNSTPTKFFHSSESNFEFWRTKYWPVQSIRLQLWLKYWLHIKLTPFCHRLKKFTFYKVRRPMLNKSLLPGPNYAKPLIVL